MRFRALLPYALTALVVVGGSSFALAMALGRPEGSTPLRVESSPVPFPLATAATSRPLPELSRTGRLAYWRENRLWISNLDGTLRRPISTIDGLHRVSLTRWSPPGDAVGFVDSGLLLVVLALDGTRAEFAIDTQLRTAGFRIGDVRWSHDGRRAAATMHRTRDGRTDVYLADLTKPNDRPIWKRATALDDAFAGDWIDDDELLVHTAGGIIGILRAGMLDDIRPLSGLIAGTPILADDGRIHFLSGRSPLSRDAAQPWVAVSRPTVFSMTVDGTDLRQEMMSEVMDLRLDGRLPDGRYLVHQSLALDQGIMGATLEAFPAPRATTIERLRLSPDGRTAYGFGGSRISKIDATKIGASGKATGDAATVFLDSVHDGDVWFPRTVKLARSSGAAAAGGPQARFGYILGGHLWLADVEGRPSLAKPNIGTRRLGVPSPRWSPDGERLVTFEPVPTALTSTTFAPLLIDRSGKATRLEGQPGAGRSVSWSPDGKTLAVVVDRRGLNTTSTDAELEVRFLNSDGAVVREPQRASEVAWTRAGMYFLGGGTRLDQAIEISTGSSTRALVSAATLAADPRVAAEAAQSTASLSQLFASPDGAFVSARLQISGGGATRPFIAVVRAADGGALSFIQANTLSDLAWSPATALSRGTTAAGPLLAYTLDIRTSLERTVVRDPAGNVLAQWGGRFGGWAPDGKWVYVVRGDGLYAYPLGSGEAARVSPVGTPVAAAQP